MSKFVITLDDKDGKIKVTTSGIPEGGNLSELEKMGTKLAKMAENFSSSDSVWEKIVKFLIG